MSTHSSCLNSATANDTAPLTKVFAGIAMLHTECIDMAEQFFLEAISGKPDAAVLAAALAGMGIAATSRGELSEAEELLRGAMAADEANWEYPYHLAEVHTLMGNDIASVAKLLLALDMDSGCQAARYIKRNPFFRELLINDELGQLVEERIVSVSSSDGGALLPTSAWSLHDAVAMGAIRHEGGGSDDYLADDYAGAGMAG